jgi:transcriptional regulator with XRE-family HTH domain
VGISGQFELANVLNFFHRITLSTERRRNPPRNNTGIGDAFGHVAFMTTMLPNRHQASDISIEAQLCSFGARLRELRLRRGFTLEELAEASGLSRGFLSRLESGGRQASISAVLTLSRILEVSLSFLFESPLALEPCVIVRAADAEEKTANGLKYAVLSNAGRFSRMQPLRIKVSATRRGKEHYQHQGEEWLYVLSGNLVLSLAGNTYNLGPGDSAHFESRLPHRLIAPGPGDAEVLLVASPDSSPGHQSVFQEHRAIPDMGVIPLPKQRQIAGTETPRKTANPATKPTAKTRKKSYE